MEPRLAEILGRLAGSADKRSGEDLGARLRQLVETAPPSPSGSALEVALRSHRWVLDRAADGGLPLTAAGYLKPADVVALAEVLPTMQDWPWSITREVDVHPLHHFRESLQSAGLLRKHQGRLVLTKTGQQARIDPARLWAQLRARLIPAKPAFDGFVGIVILLHAATTAEERLDMVAIARTMVSLGWSHQGGKPVLADDVWPVWNDLWAGIGNVGSLDGRGLMSRSLSGEALSLVRDVLLEEDPVPYPGPTS